MNESTPPTDSKTAAAPAAAPTTPGPAPTRGRRGDWRALFTLFVLAALLVGGYFLIEARREAARQQQLVAQHVREAVDADARAAVATKQAQEAQRRAAELELAQAASAAAEAPLAGDEATVLEVERLITLAAQDVQLTRQTATAIAALELADARLAASGSLRWQALRRALRRDIDRLRALPVIDVTGIALKLDQQIAAADVWPLLAAANLPAVAAPTAPLPPAKLAPRAGAKKAAPAETAEDKAAAAQPSAWTRVRGWIAQEFGDLVRIREVATPEPLLLSDAQQKLVRQQFKLRLLGARLALLARNDRLYHADIEQSMTQLALYFDAKAPAVIAAAAQLRQLNAVQLGLEPPNLSESQAAVRSARQRRP